MDPHTTAGIISHTDAVSADTVPRNNSIPSEVSSMILVQATYMPVPNSKNTGTSVLKLTTGGGNHFTKTSSGLMVPPSQGTLLSSEVKPIITVEFLEELTQCPMSKDSSEEKKCFGEFVLLPYKLDGDG